MLLGMEMVATHPRRLVQAAARGDRLASVGIRALLRVETFRSFREGDEVITGLVEVLDVSIEISEVPFE